MSAATSGRAKALFCLTLLVSFAGCAPGASVSTGDPSAVSIITGTGRAWQIRRTAEVRLNQPVTVSQEQAWAVLPEVFEALGVEPDVRDPASRRLGVSQHRFSRRVLNRPASDFFDCGLDPGLNRPTADQVPITVQIVTEVRAVGAGAELQTTVQGTARRSGGNAGVATCRSTGLMETLIGEMVQRMAAPPA